MKTKNYILIGTVIIALVIFCVYIYQITQESGQNQKEKILDVQLKVSAPFSTAILLVNNQGTINYEAEVPRKNIKKQVDSIIITKEQFDDLANLIVQNNFWSYNESYFDSNLMDATTYIVKVKSVPTYQPELADAKIYSISCYGNCPEKIVEIIDKIKELWGKEILEIGL